MSQRTGGRPKPRDSNPYGALNDSMDSSIDSRRSSWASRRSSRLSTGSEVDLLDFVEASTFKHTELDEFDESIKPAAAKGAGDRRKTFDTAAAATQGVNANENRRNTLGSSSSSSSNSSISLAVFSAEKPSRKSVGSSTKRSWSNQSPSASVLSERLSDRKRVGKSPGGRRMTADPDDLAALMSEFDCDASGTSGSATDNSALNVSLSIQDVTSAILAKEDPTEENDASNTSHTSHTFSTLDTQDGLEPFSDDRRATADPADLAAMIAALNDSDPDQSKSQDVSMMSAASGNVSLGVSISDLEIGTPGSVGTHKSHKSGPRSGPASAKSAAPTPGSVKSVQSVKALQASAAKSVAASVTSAKSVTGGQQQQQEKEENLPEWQDDENEQSNTTTSSIDFAEFGTDFEVNARRTTADATDMQAVMRELEAEEQEAAGLQSKQGDVEEQEQDRSTASAGSVMTRSMRNALAAQAQTNLNTSTTSNASSKGRGRKMTTTKDTRRMTADPADMATLLDNLNDSTASVGGPRRGRESIDTVVLVQSVANMLDDVEDPAEGEELNISTLSYSIASAGSSRRTSRSSMSMGRSSMGGMGASPGGGRRMTADTADLAAFANELNAPVQEDSEVVTEPTALLLASVERGLGGEEEADTSAMNMSAQGRDESTNMSVSMEAAAEATEADAGDHVAMETSFRGEDDASTCSLGGLLRRDISRTESPMAIQGMLQAPVSPTTTALPTTKGTGLKSCLSSRKVRPASQQPLMLPPASARKSVIFGSPKAAEFVFDGPTNALTPMHRDAAKSLFSMVGSHVQPTKEEEEDEVTAENSRILDEWDRLTNTSGEGSDDDEIALPATPAFADASPVANTGSSGRRRRSMLQPPLDANAEAADVSQMSHTSDATGTVALPGDLAELLRQNASPKPVAPVAAKSPALLDSSAMSEDRTQDLEADLESVLRHVDYNQHSILLEGDSANTSELSEVSRMSHKSATSTASGSSSSSGVSLGPLLGRPPVVAGATPLASPAGTPMSNVGSTESEVSFLRVSDNAKKAVQFNISNSDISQMQDGQTVQLEGRLGDLLDTSINTSAASAASVPGVIKGKKRVNTPRPSKFDNSINDEEEDEEHTQRLESDLNDLVANLNQSESPLSVIMASGQKDDEHYYGNEEDNAVNISDASTRSLGSEVSRDQDFEEDAQDAHVSYNNTRNSIEVSQMMARLRTLNAGARQNSLSQCGTPLAPASRLSIGIKRQSLLNSATRVREAAGNIAAAAAKAEVEVAKPVIAAPVAPAAPPAVVDILAAANLVHATSVSESPFSLSAALNSAKAISQSNPALYPLVASALIDLLKAAVDEAKNVPADLEQLAEEWSAASPQAHAGVQMALEAHQQGESTYLTTLADQCKSLCARRWGIWEGHLLDIGTESLQVRTALIQTNIQALRAQRDRLLEQEKELNDAEKLRQRRAEVDEMQQRVRLARSALETSKQALLQINEDTSSLIESHKDRMVHLAGGEDRSAAYAAEAAALQRMQEQDDALHGARKAVEDVRLMVGVVNRLSYCRTTCYTSSAVEVEAILSAFLRVSITFSLQVNEAGSLAVSGVHVELEKSERVSSSGSSSSSSSANHSNEDKERDLAEAFFRAVLCNNDIDGPLSPRVLERVAAPSDIPSALQKISGFISALRRVSTWLQAFEVDGWSTIIQGEVVVARCPNGRHSVHMPLLTVVSGDIGALHITCLRDENNVPCVEGPVRSALSSLKSKNSIPFGSFPSGQLRKAMEAILKHV